MNRANALLFKMRKHINLKYLDPSNLLISTPNYPTSILPGPRIDALFKEL